MHLKRMPDGLPAQESSRSATPEAHDSAPPPSNPSSAELPLQREARHPSTLPVSHISTSHRFRTSSTGDDLPGNAAPTSPRPSSTALVLQRKADLPPAVAADGAIQTVETANARAQSRGAIAAEIPAAPLPPGSMGIVWRKADANGAGRDGATPWPASGPPTHTNDIQVMRQSSAEPASGGIEAAVAPPPSAGGGGDVTRLADEVSRIIARRFRIERERRGRTR
jgi:hypothetical protein